MNIFICNTAYQLIVSTQMCLTIEKHETSVIVITDVIRNAEQIAQSLGNCGLFDNVIFAKVKNIEWKESNYFSPRYRKEYITFLNRLFGSELVEKLANGSNKVFVANLSGFPIIMARYIETVSREFEFNLYEDGLSSYSQIYKEGIEYRLHNRDIIKRIKYLCIPSIISKTRNYYLFYPELMVWEPSFQIKQIPAISKSDTQMISILNNAFEYYKLVDTYSERVIFFEESYVEDGIPVDDVKIVNLLVDKFGSDDVLVKRHPRVKVNRFENMKVKYNKDTAIPWEAILLNADFSNKYLVTMTSTAVVNSILLINSDAKIVFQYGILENITNDRVRFSIEVIRKLETLFPDKLMKIDDLGK